MLRTVVCDDEQPALDLVTDLLAATGQVTIEAKTQSVDEAVAAINRGDIDLVVMDVEMPKISGVDAFSKVTVEPRPLLVFATAHPEYAVEAFGIEAIDYLLKPLTADRVAQAVAKAVRLNGLIRASEDGTEKAGAPAAKKSGMLNVKDAGRVYLIPYDEVIWIEAAGDYSLVHSVTREYAIRTSITALETELPDGDFVRVHRSSIVAAAQVREIRFLPKGDAQITLDGGASVKASRTYRDAVRGLAAIV